MISPPNLLRPFSSAHTGHADSFERAFPPVNWRPIVGCPLGTAMVSLQTFLRAGSATFLCGNKCYLLDAAGPEGSADNSQPFRRRVSRAHGTASRRDP